MANFQKAGTQLLLLLLLCIMIMLLMMPTTDATLSKKKPKKLDFYMFIVPQNDSFLDNPKSQYTAVRTAAALRPQAFAFGTVHTFDNQISKTMSLANPAEVLGRVQGWYTNCGQHELTLCLTQTFTYDDGQFKGTFSLLGADIANAPLKYAPIVGGTGDFAFCSGVAVQKRVSNMNINNEEHNWFFYAVEFRFD